MFVGAINADLRSVLAGLAPAWQGRPIYVGCSGNATIERILASLGVGELHGNDVSLYSCALGHYLAGQPFHVTVRDNRYAWLGPWLEPGIPTVATLLLCTTAFQFADRDTPYHRRMWDAYTGRWAQLHAETCEKVKAATEGVRLRSFYAGDVVDFLTNAPEESVVISSPPTYRGGYERLYRQLDAVFDWPKPDYQLFTEERFEALIDVIRTKRVWVVSRDQPIPTLDGFQVARVQTGMRSKPVYVYSNQPGATLTVPRQKLEAVPYPRVTDRAEPPLALIDLTQGQLNTLRSEYLNPRIAPAAATVRFAVLAHGRLAGAMAFTLYSRYGNDWCDAYLMTDFAVSSAVPKLSKLVLAATLTKEVQTVLEQAACGRVQTIGTTAFTDKPVSMKYRGVYSLHSRKEGQLNYVGTAGKWTLEEAYQWWTKKQTCAA
jgi:hypothetical protein